MSEEYTKHVWHLPIGQWYTQKVLKESEQRMFIRDFANRDENAINHWEVWTNAQKEEWEQAHADDTGEVYE